MDKVQLVDNLMQQFSCSFYRWYIWHTPTHAVLSDSLDVDDSLMDDEFLMHASYDGISH